MIVQRMLRKRTAILEAIPGVVDLDYSFAVCARYPDIHRSVCVTYHVTDQLAKYKFGSKTIEALVAGFSLERFQEFVSLRQGRFGTAGV